MQIPCDATAYRDLEKLTSYRPIALLSTISKLFEKIFMVQLTKMVDNKKLMIVIYSMASEKVTPQLNKFTVLGRQSGKHQKKRNIDPQFFSSLSDV